MKAKTVSDPIKTKLREVASALDPLRLLEQVRTMQSYLVVLANSGKLDAPIAPDRTLRISRRSVQEFTACRNLTSFQASLSNAWEAGEIRPTHSAAEVKPRHLWRMINRETV